MSGPQFFETRMGQRFFEVTMPKIADELARLNTTLLGLSKALSTSQTKPAAPDLTSASPAAPAAVVGPALTSEVMATLAEIAREHLGIVTLEERKLDRLDFYELGVRSVAAALRVAYDAGLAAGVLETSH